MGIKCIGVGIYGLYDLRWICSVDEWDCTFWSGSVLLNVGLQYLQTNGSVQTKVLSQNHVSKLISHETPSPLAHCDLECTSCLKVKKS